MDTALGNPEVFSQELNQRFVRLAVDRARGEADLDALAMQTFDQSIFELYEAGRISYEDALRFADSTNEVRLNIKLHGKEAKGKDITKGIEHLDIV